MSERADLSFRRIWSEMSWTRRLVLLASVFLALFTSLSIGLLSGVAYQRASNTRAEIDRVREIVGGGGDPTFESPWTPMKIITGSRPHFVSPTFLSNGLDACRLVGRIESSNPSSEDVFKFHGTAFLVAGDWVLTNLHVFQECGNDNVYFTYESADGVAVRLKVDRNEEFRSTQGLDFVFLKLVTTPGVQVKVEVPHFLFYAAAMPPAKDDPMNIIQYPKGKTKQLVVQNNRLIAFEKNGSLIYYEGDTLEGSSGSPVFDNAWRLVALHRGNLPGKLVNCGIDIYAIYKELLEAKDQGKLRKALGIE